MLPSSCRPPGLRVFAIGVASSVACLDAPEVDLSGPRVVAHTLDAAEALAVPVRADIEVEFSEALDWSSVHAGSVALVSFEVHEACELDPRCEAGWCWAGRCQEDALRVSELNDLDAGSFSAGVPLEIDPCEGSAEPEACVHLRPLRALEPRRRHALLFGAAVRDLGGASLRGEDEAENPGRWRVEFVTAREGSSGPEAVLESPLAGSMGVPTNLERVATSFAQPVNFDAAATLELEPETGAPPIGLSDPSPCEGWVPGTCAWWSLEGELATNTRYRPRPGTLRDTRGRAGVPAHRERWFRTGPGADLEPPMLEHLHVRAHGDCLVAELFTDEALRLRLTIDDSSASVEGQGHLRAALRAFGPAEVAWRVEAEDLAGNVSARQGVASRPTWIDPGLPSARITEVLANPRGPEPRQEFVEIRFAEDAALPELRLADLEWDELVVAAGGGEFPGDVLPALDLAAGELLVVVPEGYDLAEGSDPAPAPGARVVRVDASLGAGGLKNAGEPLTLYRADPLAWIASYGNWIDTSASAHAGRSVAPQGLEGCDLPEAWASSSSATPGTWP